MCQKYLREIPRAKDHRGVLSNQVKKMSQILGDDYAGYVHHLRFVLGRKSDTEYGVANSVTREDAEALRAP